MTDVHSQCDYVHPLVRVESTKSNYTSNRPERNPTTVEETDFGKVG